MAMTYEEWAAGQHRREAKTALLTRQRKLTPFERRLEVIRSLSHTQAEDVLVAVARDHPEAFDRARAAAL